MDTEMNVDIYLEFLRFALTSYANRQFQSYL